MAGYAAVISLKHTINGLVNSPRFSSVSSTKKILESALVQTENLQQVVERLNDSRRSREWLDALECQIRDCAHKLEDVLEFHELNSRDDEYEDEEVRHEVTSFTRRVNKMMEKDDEYVEEEEEEEEEDDDGDASAASSYIDYGVEMVGRSEESDDARYKLLSNMRPDDWGIFMLLGERGSGRSIVAKTVYEDFCEGKEKKFERCAWVTVGTDSQPNDVLMSIILQIDDGQGRGWEDQDLSDYLYSALEQKVYMIVLDDVHDLKLMDQLPRHALPFQNNGSIILITTHLKEVVQYAHNGFLLEPYSLFFQRFLWSYLFVPSTDTELQEAANKILDNCGGSYVSAVKAFLLLMKTEMTVEEWRKIAADEENPIFMVEHEISEINTIVREVQYSFHHNWLVDDSRRRSIRKYILRTINLPDAVEELKMQLFPKRFFSKMRILSVFGMAGIGKTTYVKNLLKDNSIASHFDCHAWITLGPKYRSRDILIDILAKIYPHNDKLHMKGDIDLVKELCAQVSSKRCLIVLDDLWSTEPLHHLRNLFPNIKGTILVTTRQGEVASLEKGSCYRMQLLDKEESWSLLRQKVFGGGECPPELEKVGLQIAENCDGLPLLILTVADQLLKVEISEEFWNNVASGKEKSIFNNAQHQISKTLLPSYQGLPQHLKSCFLYMGIFRVKYEIPIFDLADLLIAEGFLEPNSSQVAEDLIAKCLTNLVDKSLVMEQLEDYSFDRKRCRLHVVFWHLCNDEAMKNKFFHAMNSYGDCFVQSIRDHRRLCIRNSILLGFKDVQDSIASNITAHSLMCVGPFHQYQVPLNFDMRLLRVMNALTIRLYEFPTKVMSQIQLRYLSLTCNGKLPMLVSNLWKLEYLIVKRYMNTNSSEDSLLLPVEIWNMKKLKHLEVTGGRLPDCKCGLGLPNLSTLLDVSAESCREEVLQWIPNLKKLGILIELTPNDEGDSFRHLNSISILQKLESLKCVVVNPRIKSEFVPPILMLPSGLKRLSLCGLGYPWEHMNRIGELEDLEVLKIKRYAFQGPKWETDLAMQFAKLTCLVIEDTNLVHWKITSPIPTRLSRISIKHCYKLRELPSAFHVHQVQMINIVDCNNSTQSWARKTTREIISNCNVEVALSWIAGTIKNHS